MMRNLFPQHQDSIPATGTNDNPSMEESSRNSNQTSPAIPREVSTTTRNQRSHAVLPWSMHLTRLGYMYCQECGVSEWNHPSATDDHNLTSLNNSNNANTNINNVTNNNQSAQEENIEERYNQIFSHWQEQTAGTNNNATFPTSRRGSSSSTPAISPHAVAPMLLAPSSVSLHASVQNLLHDYVLTCKMYSCQPNSGVLTTIRFHIPAMRVAGPFHDADMLALAEILIRYINGPLAFLRRLDFSRASKEGIVATTSSVTRRRKGFRSHGALALAKVVAISQNLQEVKLQRHRVGHFGATAIFMAASKNSSLQKLVMRRCQIGERGALAFAEIVCPSTTCGLCEVDLSANQIGFQGCMAVEKALEERDADIYKCLNVDLEGNFVLQEVMNGITHGLGVLLSIMGSILLQRRVEFMPPRYVISCAIYSGSLLVLYISSTLYHSFFTMQNTKYIFEALDKCAIYVLIAGSYTPFLQIVLGHKEHWSVWLLAFIWSCCICGIYVEASFPAWKHKKIFSLFMYLGMGWSALVCIPDLFGILPQSAINLLILGGVGYTSGVPFFVRNNNLDHSIWHLFVLAGSIFHWLGIYWHVATMDPNRQTTCAANMDCSATS